jgi:DNA repair protein RadA/Sms
LASAATQSPAPHGVAFVGEVGLTGMVRPVAGMERRLAAAAAAGAGTVYLAGEANPPPGVTVSSVRHVRDALAWARRRSSAPRS